YQDNTIAESHEPALVTVPPYMADTPETRIDIQRSLFDAPRPEIEFYDTDNDPWELENLAARPEHREPIAEHFALLQEWRKATGDFPPERRRRAGYVDRVTGVLYSLDVPPMFNE
ncbi:MAG: hypothetical protein ACREQ1_13790, partial [Woeseiaceae bacterium]